MEVHTETNLIGVPRCQECNKLYKKSEANEYGLCPKCFYEKNSKDEPANQETSGDGQPSKITQEPEIHKAEHSKAEELTDVKSEKVTLRPGQMIRDKFAELISKGFITEELLTILTDKEGTANALGVRYAFLKEYNPDIPLKELTYIGKHPRYTAQPIEINVKQYLITNDLYKTNLPRFLEWADAIIQSDNHQK